MRLDVYEYTSKGGREYNEDCLGSRFNGSEGIFAAADGLGGHLFGEKASKAAIDTIIAEWDFTAEDIPEQLRQSFARANRNILDMQTELKAVMKTTAAVLAISGNKAFMANTGDTRIYFVRNGELRFYTNDHSVAFKKFRAREITHDQISSDEDQSCLLRTLGSPERYEPELYAADTELEPGDAFLICTDGAWEYIRDDEIPSLRLRSQNAKQWADCLKLCVNQRAPSDSDNLSMLTVMLV